MTTGMVEGKCSRMKLRGKISDGLTKWQGVGRVTDALNMMRDQDAWRVMVGSTTEGDT